MAASADSTIASRRDALLGLLVAGVAVVPVIRSARKPEFDALAYLNAMRALGSDFYVIEDSSTGRVGLYEGFPDDGWTDAEHAQMLDLCGQYRACPDGKKRVVSVLKDEGLYYVV